MSGSPKLRMVAGPNGSGKSTLLNYLFEISGAQKFNLGHVLNPDELQKELEGKGSFDLGRFGVTANKDNFEKFISAHPLRKRLTDPRPTLEDNVLVAPAGYRAGYFLPVLSDFIRADWIARRESFTFETVMSDPAKLVLLSEARGLGYRTYLYFICTETAVINRERIAARVASGGHAVPDEKIEDRYDRSRSLLLEASRLVDRAYLFDNSAREHRLVAEFEAGNLTVMPPVPAWLHESVLVPLIAESR